LLTCLFAFSLFIGESKGFAKARGNEVEEFILRLELSEAGDFADVE
jgi:hypothetical protein